MTTDTQLVEEIDRAAKALNIGLQKAEAVGYKVVLEADGRRFEIKVLKVGTEPHKLVIDKQQALPTQGEYFQSIT